MAMERERDIANVETLCPLHFGLIHGLRQISTTYLQVYHETLAAGRRYFQAQTTILILEGHWFLGNSNQKSACDKILHPLIAIGVAGFKSLRLETYAHSLKVEKRQSFVMCSGSHSAQHLWDN